MEAFTLIKKFLNFVLSDLENKKITTPVGFEPTRAKPNGLAGRRLNHSAKVSFHIFNIVGVTLIL